MGKNYLISEAYFSFVALDKNGAAASVVAVEPETPLEKKQFDAALSRKKKRIQLKKNSV